MTWSEAAECIATELRRLMTKQAEWIGVEDLLPDDESDARAVRDLHLLERDTRAALDAAVREFAQTGEWPPLAMECRYVLSRRLFCALDLLHTLSLPTESPFVPDPTADRKTTLVWLLETTWRSRAERWLLAAGRAHLRSPSDFGEWEDSRTKSG